MNSTEKAALICEFADDMKAERIDTLDVRTKTSVTDYFVVCSGNSDTHVRAIAERVAEKLRDKGVRPLRTEEGDSGWVLQDFGDVVLNVMREEKRQFYSLESLWREMQTNPDLL
ncbi:MAG: ribosome silencing factor [Armatimonadetes bacterium]|nr:ribosome silencing factor [Armatimonadota bacterium]